MIIFVGLAGSGKSIQGRLLAQKIKAEYYSIGELLRQNVNPEIKEKMLTGTLISDEDVIKLIDQSLPVERSGENVQSILDGFPRSLAQADWLIKEIKRGRFDVKGVIHLKANPETIIPRLIERHRPDDHLEAINKRIQEYNQTILPIIDQLKAVGVKVYNINAEQPIESVQRDILTQLNIQA